MPRWAPGHERYKPTADQAFQALAQVLVHTNHKVRDVVDHLVLTGEFHLPQPLSAQRTAGRALPRDRCATGSRRVFRMQPPRLPEEA
ncbi:hypothetical protein [Geodermatophilus amargosae]|uniref:hypothetical protein n=1 Tax=Geodermatophilus amargosae TaxID=1296565 RepID=UPI0034E002AC